MFHPKMKDAFWGFIIGDAFGVPYEFSDREEMKARPASSTMIGYGTFNQPKGTWSDDTSIMLCVMENMQRNGNAKSLAKLFVKWEEFGYHTPHGEAFDIGNTTREAIERLKEGVSAQMSGSRDAHAAGNGSLMRTVPYALRDGDFSELMFNMASQHGITHKLRLCTEISFYYAKLLRSLAEGRSKEEALKSARGYLQKGWRLVDQPDEAKFHQYAQQFHRLFTSDFATLPEHVIKSTGYVLDTIEAVVWSFMQSTSYQDAILKAVNLGEDTDTIAALTGALAGVYYGVESIPEVWLNAIVRREELKKQFSFL